MDKLIQDRKNRIAKLTKHINQNKKDFSAVISINKTVAFLRKDKKYLNRKLKNIK